MMKNSCNPVCFCGNAGVTKRGTKSKEESHNATGEFTRLSDYKKCHRKGKQNCKEENKAEFPSSCFDNWCIVITPENHCHEKSYKNSFSHKKEQQT